MKRGTAIWHYLDSTDQTLGLDRDTWDAISDAVENFRDYASRHRVTEEMAMLKKAYNQGYADGQFDAATFAQFHSHTNNNGESND